MKNSTVTALSLANLAFEYDKLIFEMLLQSGTYDKDGNLTIPKEHIEAIKEHILKDKA